MRMERTVREIAGDYAVLENETGGTTEVALALLPDGIAEGTVLIFENFEYHIKESTPLFVISSCGNSAKEKRRTANNSCPACRHWTA